MNNKNIKLLFAGFVLILISLGAFLFVRETQKKTTTSIGAAASTKLYFMPATTTSAPLNKQVGDNISLDVMVDPGNNLPTIIQLKIPFDSTKLTPASTPFTVNSAKFPTVNEGPVVQNGNIYVTVSTGSSPSQVIQTTTKVGTVNLTAKAATTTPVKLEFAAPYTKVFSAGPNDNASDNVLSTSTPAFITIGGGGSTGTPSPSGPTGSGARCSDNKDNDNNGFKDAADSTCHTDGDRNNNNSYDPNKDGEHGGGTCTDGKDNNGDGKIDGVDPSCHDIQCTPASPVVTGSPVPTPVCTVGPYNPTLNENDTCDDKKDNNNNGLIDAQDPVCHSDNNADNPTSYDPTKKEGGNNGGGNQLSLNVSLHGIGNSGDNANPIDSSLSNKSPRNKTRAVTVEAFDALNNAIATASGSIVFDTSTGTFKGIVGFGSIPSGVYNMKVQSPTHLRRLITGVTLSTTQPIPLNVTLIAGDVNSDNKLNILDYNLLIGCYSDLAPAVSCTDTTKLTTDLNDDGKVNQTDTTLYQREIIVRDGD